MKLLNNPISNIIKSRKKTTGRRVHLLYPRRDWYVGIMIGVLLLAAIATWSVYTYLDNRSIEANNVVPPQEIPVYRASSVAEALEYFDNRRREFDELQASAPPVTLPLNPPTTNSFGEGSATVVR